MEILAERTLTLEPANGGQPSPIRVVLGRPEPRPEGDWMTPYEIHGPGPDDVWKACACGVDAMQSIVLGLFALPHELAARLGHLGRLTWEGSPDLGFQHVASP
jgi:hypothetical protein